MQTLTHSQLASAISARKGTTFIGIDSLTDSRAKKTGNPFGKIMKQTRFVGTVGADYGSAVKRQSGDSEFEAQSLPWGEWTIPGKVISHKGKFYLRTQTIAKQRKTTPKVKFRNLEGKFLGYKDVKPFLPAPSHSKRQEDSGIEETALQVQPRNFAFDSILRVRLNGRTFKLIPD